MIFLFKKLFKLCQFSTKMSRNVRNVTEMSQNNIPKVGFGPNFVGFYACTDSRWKNLLGTNQKSVKLAFDRYPACVFIQRKENVFQKCVGFFVPVGRTFIQEIFERKTTLSPAATLE